MNLKKYSVANTTREEREERAAMAQAINSLGAEPVSPEDEVLFQRHIDGELEIEEVTQMLIDKYKKSPEDLAEQLCVKKGQIIKMGIYNATL